jgi:transposase
MSNPTPVTVGLDVHARSVRLAALRADELLEERTLPYDHTAIERAIARWPGVRACYEAGPTGYGLARHLTAAGIECSVVAPALVPQRPGDRVKTDSRDARKLARLHQGGLLEAVWVPDPETEAARDLIRAREDARIDRMRDRHRLSKFCLRNGLTLPGRSWGVKRRAWLARQSFANLRCLRGIDTLSALGLAVEIGDFHRFKGAEKFMGFVGLVPSEHSSGERRAQGSITKVGNTHVRRLLIEAAWHSRLQPKVGYELARRQRGADPAVIERSWRAQQRLHRRWRRMAARGKPHQKIVVACARELAGFVWAIATEQPLHNT